MLLGVVLIKKKRLLVNMNFLDACVADLPVASVCLSVPGRDPDPVDFQIPQISIKIDKGLIRH